MKKLLVVVSLVIAQFAMADVASVQRTLGGAEWQGSYTVRTIKALDLKARPNEVDSLPSAWDQPETEIKMQFYTESTGALAYTFWRPPVTSSKETDDMSCNSGRSYPRSAYLSESQPGIFNGIIYFYKCNRTRLFYKDPRTKEAFDTKILMLRASGNRLVMKAIVYDYTEPSTGEVYVGVATYTMSR